MTDIEETWQNPSLKCKLAVRGLREARGESYKASSRSYWEGLLCLRAPEVVLHF